MSDTKKPLIEISNLHVSVEETEILKGLNLTINSGEVHAIMGPNGSGKSTLANVIAGRPEYEITNGSISFCNQNLLEMDPETRAREGLFLAFQYPVELPGVRSWQFLKSAVDAKRQFSGESEMKIREFDSLLSQKIKIMEVDEDLVKRSVNEGFSGGEKKRNEILQMLLLDPKLALLDETDSGLDIDALKTIAEGVNKFRNKDRSFLAITHYQRLLDYMHPDYIHVLIDGKIMKSGDISLAHKLEEKGYSWLES